METIIFNGLIDIGTQALLVPSRNPSILVLLNEWEGNTLHLPNLHYPNYSNGRFFSRLKRGEYVRWTWNWKSRYFSKTRKDLITPELQARSNLLAAKHDLMYQIIFNINIARYPVRSGIEFQETVYMTKKLQAQRFKDIGYDDSVLIEYPYVLQYAELANLSSREAADDILLKSSFDDQVLARTELLRLKFFNKIKAVREESELQSILEEFYRECYTNAHV